MTGTLLIIIPAFNESGRVGAVVHDVATVLPEADVLVVNDGSADDTAAEASRAGAMVLSLPINSGYGAALQTGYKYAVRHEYDTLAQIDADGQHQARYLREMLDALEANNCDVVVGSRFLDGDGHYRPSACAEAGNRLLRAHRDASSPIRPSPTRPPASRSCACAWPSSSAQRSIPATTRTPTS